jgi:exosome complex RNA-binding protein Csl4
MRPAGGALASTQASGRMALAEIIQHISLVQEVMHTVMKPDVHYGKIPGTDKPTLYKNGAEVLCMVFRIAQSYEVVDMSTADVVRYRSVAPARIRCLD